MFGKVKELMVRSSVYRHRLDTGKNKLIKYTRTLRHRIHALGQVASDQARIITQLILSYCTVYLLRQIPVFLY